MKMHSRRHIGGIEMFVIVCGFWETRTGSRYYKEP